MISVDRTSEAKEESEDEEVDFGDPMVQHASVVIQSGFRGMKARKEVHELRLQEAKKRLEDAVDAGDDVNKNKNLF